MNHWIRTSDYPARRGRQAQIGHGIWCCVKNDSQNATTSSTNSRQSRLVPSAISIMMLSSPIPYAPLPYRPIPQPWLEVIVRVFGFLGLSRTKCFDPFAISPHNRITGGRGLRFASISARAAGGTRWSFVIQSAREYAVITKLKKSSLVTSVRSLPASRCTFAKSSRGVRNPYRKSTLPGGGDTGLVTPPILPFGREARQSLRNQSTLGVDAVAFALLTKNSTQESRSTLRPHSGQYPLTTLDDSVILREYCIAGYSNDPTQDTLCRMVLSRNWIHFKQLTT